ncbi:S46 family peptidase [Mesorhizobium sp. M0208]|uniref:S46 family peptidase n=1 Tax=Mesorhizobium sp. M0208 TaxID=2956916 RepID=UPI00333BE6AA
MRDVTAEILKGVSDKLNGFARYERLATNRKALIAACEGQPNRRCDVGAYYGGASYYLQQKLEIEDVRLVYAPALGIGNFGGETDNWMWPRHTGDFGFYRAYVAPDGSSRPYARDNVPYRPKSWLPIACAGVKEGDLVMVAGFPGAIHQFLTADKVRSTSRNSNRGCSVRSRIMPPRSKGNGRQSRGADPLTARFTNWLGLKRMGKAEKATDRHQNEYGRAN